MDSTERICIHELLARSAYALDEREVEMLADCFAEEAVLTLRIAKGDLIGPFEGRSGIMKLMTDSMAEQTDQRRHVVSNVHLSDITEESAEATSNLTLISVKDGRLDTISSGLYRDRVIRERDGWRLISRHIELDLPY